MPTFAVVSISANSAACVTDLEEACAMADDRTWLICLDSLDEIDG